MNLSMILAFVGTSLKRCHRRTPRTVTTRGTLHDVPRLSSLAAGDTRPNQSSPLHKLGTAPTSDSMPRAFITCGLATPGGPGVKPILVFHGCPLPDLHSVGRQVQARNLHA